MAGDILIIDGVATNRIVLKVELLESQYRVRPCATLNEARAEIAASLPDLILLDISNDAEQMYAFCHFLKADANTNLIPIIATGGFQTPRDRVVALEAGADDVLTKPFDDHTCRRAFEACCAGAMHAKNCGCAKILARPLGLPKPATDLRRPRGWWLRSQPTQWRRICRACRKPLITCN
jgi:DNA-binding response OmpR family regulator